MITYYIMYNPGQFGTRSSDWLVAPSPLPGLILGGLLLVLVLQSPGSSYMMNLN